ncbi:MAG TPA: hypothetical protein VLV49_09850 [Terriglobales bacterium]|nr:hypothetical protein [Terriglobales bacterium]
MDGACSSSAGAGARKAEECGCSETKRKDRPNPRQQQGGSSHYPGGQARCASDKTSHRGSYDFSDIPGFTLGPAQEYKGLFRYALLPQLPHRFFCVIA